MFRESADSFIAESIGKMTASDKKQLLKFIEMQAAYKRAAKMSRTVKAKAIRMEEIVAIVRKGRKSGAKTKNRLSDNSCQPYSFDFPGEKLPSNKIPEIDN
jgi:hypothetical protein